MLTYFAGLTETVSYIFSKYDKVRICDMCCTRKTISNSFKKKSDMLTCHVS